MKLLAIDHVQLAMPAGQETQARDFYTRVLGLPELQKPATLAGRGGAWFGHDGLEIHLGVEKDFAPARKAHPAFLVDDVKAVAARLRAASFPVIEDDLLPGYDRFFTADPFGNRIEIMQPKASPSS
jgi:catechol 2,3-dioxygenase-like lactoylglutathione lyase family enzyme